MIAIPVNPNMKTAALAVAVAAAAAVAFLPALRAGWVFDDANLVQPSPALQDLAGLRRAVSTDLYRQAAPRLEASPYWRPLAMASFWLDARLGEAPRALHLGNILLHALAAALLALAIRRRQDGGAGLVAAALAAAWWAFHPGNVEAVAWISCRYDLLCGVALLGLVAVPWKAGPLRAAVHGLLFLAGLLSKDGFGAMLVVVPAMDWAERRTASAAAPRWVAVLAAVGAWWGARRLLGIPSMDPPPLAMVPQLLAQYLDAAGTYLARAVMPLSLTIDHPYVQGGPVAIGAGAGVVLGSVALAIWRRRLAVAVAIFLAGLVPVALALSRFGEAPERYLYVPSIGLALLVGELVAASLRAGREGLGGLLRPVVPAAVGLVAIAGLIRVEARLPEWQSDGALFAAALRVNPEDAQANLQLAIEAGRRRDWAEARRMLEVAQRSAPQSARVAGALAWALLQSGDVAGALGQAERATSLAPYQPDGWYYRALASHRLGDHAGELAAIDQLLRVSPDYPGARGARTVAACEASGRTDCLQSARSGSLP